MKSLQRKTLVSSLVSLAVPLHTTNLYMYISMKHHSKDIEIFYEVSIASLPFLTANAIASSAVSN